jgi:deoxyribodipyrimidine photolyase-like uncharacterized protein
MHGIVLSESSYYTYSSSYKVICLIKPLIASFQMKAAAVIFPHHLFKNHPGLSRDREVFLVEDQLFFSDPEGSLRFHKKKLILHRASRQAYRDRLKSQGYSVRYLDFGPDPKMSYLFKPLLESGGRTDLGC